MPAIKTSPKKTGAPKAKGAVRAKSGCYTCRIRRKKCDERPNEEGFCETCVRLRVQCLGFGAKRPEWLRENARVVDLREKIKTFLASQGMIKGHSGSGPRNGEAEQTLVLSNEDYSSSSESPPTQTLSLSEGDYRTTHHTSAVRDQTWLTPNTDSYESGPNSLLRQNASYDRYSAPHHQGSQLRPPSPYGGSDDYPPSYPFSGPPPAPLHSNSSNNLVPWSSTGAATFSTRNIDGFLNYAVTRPNFVSSFGNSYSLPGLGDEDFVMSVSEDFLSPFLGISPGGMSDELIQHYMKTTIFMQYLLHDKRALERIVIRSVENDSNSHAGAKLLAAIHRQRKIAPHVRALPSNQAAYESLQHILQKESFSADDAMAALHLVSTILFDGGIGEWNNWLKVASTYTKSLFLGASYGDYRDTFLRCNEKEQFLIKTTIWFDVLASITTLQPPAFLELIRGLWKPHTSGVYDPSLSQDQLSMMPIMGCDNVIVWALAETSSLSAWKNKQHQKGCLSMPDLVSKGAEIEGAINSDAPGTTIADQIDDNEYEPNHARRLTADAFRAAARLYVRSVVSGDYPSVPEIKEAVEETFNTLQKLPQNADQKDPVVRSAVFAVFLCGCLTEDAGHSETIITLLRNQTGPGNCSAVSDVLEDVWVLRTGKSVAVPWRQLIHERQLLLV